MIADKELVASQLDAVKEYIVDNLVVMQSEKNGGYFFGIPGGFTHDIGVLSGTLKCSFYGLNDVTKAAAVRATRVERDVNAMTLDEAKALLAKLEGKLAQ